MLERERKIAIRLLISESLYLNHGLLGIPFTIVQILQLVPFSL